MCGIAGIINLHNPAEDSNSLIEMTQNLIHRGPDNEGYALFSDDSIPFFGDDTIDKNSQHINTSFNYKFKVGLGFRQLKIIDLSDKSHQPMSDISKKYWIIFNGEIYNYKEIKTELESLGHLFFSKSDTEVILNSYKEWGEKALNKFNGMFALAIFDINKNQIFIARDRIGIKPLYYHKNDEKFIFGSTIQSIIKSKLYIPKINWEGLWQNFRFSIAQRPNTSFQDIFALEPAYFLKVNLNDNSFEKKQYWQIPVNTQDFSLTKKQSIELIEESLLKAVNYRLVSDVEVGTFMSGGIDSTMISVVASKYKPNIKALTLGFKEYRDFDEVQQAKDTAKLHNFNHIVHYTSISEAIKNITQTTISYEEPYHNLSANFVLANMASKNNLKVVLSGLGGDELFGGYDVYNKLLLYEKVKKYKNLIQFIPNIHKKIKKGKQLSEYKTLSEYYSHYYTNFFDNELEELFIDKSYNTKDTISNLYNKNIQFTDAFETMSFYNLKSYIGNHQMRAVDQSTMAFSVEGRFPLLDHKFIETAFKIPTKYKLHNGVQKYVLKEIAKKYISKSCLQMPKKGLSLPLKHWISSYLKDFVFDTIQQLKKRHIFNRKAIEIIETSNNENKIWQLVSTELWLQFFFDK